MTKRKFTPPTKLPAEYVDGEGRKVTIVGIGTNEYPLKGECCRIDRASDKTYTSDRTYTAEGVFNTNNNLVRSDLHDLPKPRVSWINEYPSNTGSTYPSKTDANRFAEINRIGLTKRTQVDGELPVYETEDLRDG